MELTQDKREPRSVKFQFRSSVENKKALTATLNVFFTSQSARAESWGPVSGLDWKSCCCKFSEILDLGRSCGKKKSLLRNECEPRKKCGDMAHTTRRRTLNFHIFLNLSSISQLYHCTQHRETSTSVLVKCNDGWLVLSVLISDGPHLVTRSFFYLSVGIWMHTVDQFLHLQECLNHSSFPMFLWLQEEEISLGRQGDGPITNRYLLRNLQKGYF